MTGEIDPQRYPFCVTGNSDLGWAVHVQGMNPLHFTNVDRLVATQVFDRVKTAYELGREDAFRELRQLIGAAKEQW